MIIPNKVTQNVELFVEALENSRVTRLFAVTSLIRNMLALLDMESRKDNKPNRLSKVREKRYFLLIPKIYSILVFEVPIFCRRFVASFIQKK